MKKNDKVICIDNTGYNLTIGKEYVLIKDSTNYIVDIYDDNGYYMLPSKSRFKKLSDIRDEKLNKILNK